jgi:hypothetical protein
MGAAFEVRLPAAPAADEEPAAKGARAKS